jgi:hypothetical protein
MSEVKNTITATKKGEDRKVTVNYTFPETLGALVEKFGEDQVLSAATGKFTIDLQAVIRRNWESDDAAIQSAVDAWQPGVRGPVTKATPMEKATRAVAAMSDEDRAALIAKLQALQNGG